MVNDPVRHPHGSDLLLAYLPVAYGPHRRCESTYPIDLASYLVIFQGLFSE